MCYQTHPFNRSWSYHCHCCKSACTCTSSFWAPHLPSQAWDLCQKLQKHTWSLFIRGPATTLALPKTLLELTILVVLATFQHNVSHRQAPMFLAQGKMLCIHARLLGDRFMKQNHFLLAQVAGVRLPLLSWLFFLCPKGLCHLLKIIQQVTDTLGYCICLELILSLPSPRAHTKDMACKIGIINGPDIFLWFWWLDCSGCDRTIVRGSHLAAARTACTVQTAWWEPGWVSWGNLWASAASFQNTASMCNMKNF